MDEYLRNWLFKALEDFRLAKQGLSFPEEEVATGPVCLLSQQAVEKLLKAYLVFKGRDFERSHDLDYLAKLCSEFEPDFKQFNFKKLSFYAVELRYPDEFYIPSVQEAKEALQTASQVKEMVFKKLGIKEQDLIIPQKD